VSHRPPERWRRIAGATVAVAAIAAGTAAVVVVHGRLESAQLILPEPFEGATAVLPGYLSQDHVFGGLPFCLDRPGRVTITGVKAADGSLDVTGWAARLHDPTSDLGSTPGTLASNGLATTGQPLTVVCDMSAAPRFYVLLVQLHTRRSTTSSSGFTITYTSDGRTSALTIPFHVTVCSRSGDPACQLA
jgi:hypothetical protein